ncbi:MAG: 2Fe-2S iron-sulfur cluster binding domain-containing protein, partial [Gammaproteobacteria bacterium]|nr:2Fe-2S iron-sulfur cluster binding domain-containing protein [Gammaproteobacteria bacterium]
MAKQAKIVFTPSGKRGSFAFGTPVLDAARSLGVDVDSVCGGRGLCGRCQVSCAEGDFAKHAISSRADHLSDIGDVETRFAARRKSMKPGRRLSCQARIEGDLVIDVPAESQMHRQVVRKSAEHRNITLDTGVHLYFVEVREADMYEPSGDAQRLLDALAKDWGLQELSCDTRVLPFLQGSLRKGKWQVTVAVYRQSRVIAVWPGFRRDAFGLAMDVGSTTIAANLINLTTGEVVATDGIMNPQIRFGEDLMSRVSFVMMHPEGAKELTATVREGINTL